MKLEERARRFVKPYRVVSGRGFRLESVDPADTGHLQSKDADTAKGVLDETVELLADLQDMLYAQDRWSVLLVFQAVDAAGKDGVIKHVMSGVNPQGVQVYSFKAPSEEELDHDYLWRCLRSLPERGRIGIPRAGRPPAQSAQGRAPRAAPHVTEDLFTLAGRFAAALGLEISA